MSNQGSLKYIVDKGAVRDNRRLSLRKVSMYAGLCLGVVALASAVLILMFGNAFLNGYGRSKVQQKFSEAHPGYVLRIGPLNYSMGANRLVAQSVILSATNSTLKIGRISLTGVSWARLLTGKAHLTNALAKTSLDATNLDWEFPQSHYGIRCTRLRASVPGSELFAEGTELRPLLGDEELFAVDAFRTTRFRVVLPECKVLGLAYGELLQGKSYRARSVHLSHPSLDALVNRDKQPKPFWKSPLMVHEALAAIPRPLEVGSLNLTNGHIRYCERLVAGAAPGVLTFGSVSMSIEGIANRAQMPGPIRLQAQGDLMEAGTLKVLMMIPITPPDFSLHYSGSLSAMDLTRLDAFLDIAEHTRIKSGNANEAAFEIDVTAGQASGRVKAIYRNLEIAVLDKQTGTEKGFNNRIASFLVNVLKIRNSNSPDASGLMKEGKVTYTRKPGDEFLEFAWRALRSGVLDVISH